MCLDDFPEYLSKPFMDNYNIVISDFLEKQKDIEEGEDMADYIIKRLEVKE